MGVCWGVGVGCGVCGGVLKYVLQMNFGSVFGATRI